ncbi:MAG: type II secretion system protein GspK [Planctomycetota bacterium]
MIVLIVIAVATLAVYSFSELMIAYDESAYLAGDRVQARVNVESAIEATRLLLSQPPNAREELGGLYNNAQLFQAINVSMGADGTQPSNYSVIAPALNDTGSFGGIRFGLQDESARLNINTLVVLEENASGLTAALALTATDSADESAPESLAVSLLLALPGMTEDTADAILDWIDEDDEPRPFGAESEYYETLNTPYSPTNGPLNSVEELLLVRGVTPELLFGLDSNRNGVIDADEQQRTGQGIDTVGSLGWAAYLTVHGGEANRDGEGQIRIDVNGDDLETLYDDLVAVLGDETYASFIVAYRISGQSGSAGATGTAGGATPAGGRTQAWSVDALDRFDLSGGAGTELTQVLDLIGATVSVGDGGEAVTYSSPFEDNPIAMALYLPGLMDALSTQSYSVMPGRINLNEAPAELLYGIPLWDEETVAAVLEARAEESDDINRRYETWPMVEGLVTLDEMRLLMPLLTGGGDFYRAQVIGYFENIGAFHRGEVIIDATTINPKIVSYRDMSHLGRGFDLSTLGVRTLAPETQQ